MPYSVLLVDDHKILRDGLRGIIERAPDFAIVGEADNGLSAIRLCKSLHPDLVLMDISMPGINGIEATSEITRHAPASKVAILSISDDEVSVIGAFRSGARAFISKSASSTDLLDAMRIVVKGGAYLSPQVTGHLLTMVQRGELTAKAGPLDKLSPRELQVLRLISEGKGSKEIVSMTELSPQTVRTYRKTMMKKLGVANIAGLTQVAIRAGISRPT